METCCPACWSLGTENVLSFHGQWNASTLCCHTSTPSDQSPCINQSQNILRSFMRSTRYRPATCEDHWHIGMSSDHIGHRQALDRCTCAKDTRFMDCRKRAGCGAPHLSRLWSHQRTVRREHHHMRRARPGPCSCADQGPAK